MIIVADSDKKKLASEFVTAHPHISIPANQNGLTTVAGSIDLSFDDNTGDVL